MIRKSLKELENFVLKKQFKGCDPYDALDSKFVKVLTLGDKHLRIGAIQTFKKSPFNLRYLFNIRSGYNPKGMGLFLSAYLEKYNFTKDKQDLEKARFFGDWLTKNYSEGYSGYCWGYNFDWQNRTFFLPKNTPTIVNTAFIANAFLDIYRILHQEKYLDIARSSCDFILNNLNITRENEAICFSYTPLDKTQVHNANLLAAALLARIYSFTREENLLKFGTKAVKFSVKYQNKDGSWYYGNLVSQRWIDNFHTGFNLVALKEYIDFSESRYFCNALEEGFRYYKENFFLKDGTPKYYHDKIYPIDIHSVAQSIVTFVKLKDLSGGNINQALKIAQWGIENMQDERGFFYFQKHKYFTNRIPYMRWAEAWMFYALTLLLLSVGE